MGTLGGKDTLKGEKASLCLQVSLGVLCVVLLVLSVQFSFFRGAYPNVSAFETTGSLGIYRDQLCTQRITSLDWGTLNLGQIKETVVYVRNEGTQKVYLDLKTANWDPADASDSLVFSSTCTIILVNPGRVDKVILSLYVSPKTHDIDSFGFDIIFEGLDHFPADINGDGYVNALDAIIVGSAFSSQPGDPNWNPSADLNHDYTINNKDVAILIASFGQSWT
jgi:hypothetical protein